MSVAAGNGRLSSDQIAQFAYSAGFRGDALATAVAVALAESGGDPDVLGDLSLQDATWGPSVGLWQVRSLKTQKGTGGDRDQLALTSPSHNATAAYHISNGGSSFKPWTMYTNGQYKKYLSAAQASGTAANSTGGTAGSVTAVKGTVGYPVPAPSKLSIEPLNPRDPKEMLMRGRDLTVTIGDAVKNCTIDMTIDQVTEISVTCLDPDYDVWGADWGGAMAPIDWYDWRLELAAQKANMQGSVNYTTLSLWPRGIASMKALTGDTRTNLTPGQWIAAEAAKFGFSVVNWEAKGVERSSIGPESTDPNAGQLLVPGGASVDPSTLESIWNTMNRLAQEDGCWLWATPERQLIYGKPSVLVRALPYFDVGFRGSVDGDESLDFTNIDAEWSTDSTSHLLVNRIATLYLPRWRGERIRPGHACRLPKFAHFDTGNATQDQYIVKRVTWDWDAGNSDVRLDVQRAVDPTGSKSVDNALGEPNLALLQGGAKSTGNLTKGTRQANDFVSFALAQAGDRYVYGASPKGSDADPTQFDCSSLVQWAAAQVGITQPRVAEQQRVYNQRVSVEVAAYKRGALLFIMEGGQASHVVISLGDGQHTIEARGAKYGVVQYNIANRGITQAALITGMLYQ